MSAEGTIERFDPVDGLGDILLDDGSHVRFGTRDLQDFRAVAPAAGLRVRVDGVKPGFRGSLRASEVRLVASSYDETWHVCGLGAACFIETRIPRRRVRLVPFEPAAFARLGDALSPRDLDARAFAPATRPDAAAVLPLFAAIAPLVAPHARAARVFARTSGEPAAGATFLGGAHADLGATPWPTLDGVPLAHVLQIGRDDARAIGLASQINVFTSAASPRPVAPVMTALGHGPVLGAVPRGDSPFVLVATDGGARRASPAAGAPALALTPVGTRVVYPPLVSFHSDDPAVASQVVDFVTRVYVLDADGVEFAPGLALRSIQAHYARAFPSADDLADDLVLGGLAPPLPGEDRARRRVASARLDAFPEIRALLAHGDAWLAGGGEVAWQRWALDAGAALDAPWAYGA